MMTELVLTPRDIPGFGSNIEGATESHPLALALLEQQLDIVDSLVRKLDDSGDLSPLLDLNPICELAETIEASGANFSGALGPAKQRYLQTINLLADRAEARPNDGHKPSGYKNILFAMGWDLEDSAPAATTTPATVSPKPPRIAQEQKAQSAAAENDPPAPRSRRLVRVGGFAALVGTAFAELAVPAAAAPVPVPAAKVVAHAPVRPGTPQPKPATAPKTPENSSTTSSPPSGDSSTAATITAISEASPSTQAPTAPGATIEVTPSAGSAGKSGPGITVDIQPGNSNQGEAAPAAPGTTVSIGGNGPRETNASTDPNTAAPNPSNTDGTITVTPNTEPSNAGTTSGNGQTITVTPGTQPATSAPRSNPNTSGGNNTFDSATSDMATTITIPSSSTPEAPTVSIPIAPSQQPNTSGALEYALQNGSTTDAVQAQTQVLLGQGYAPTPDSQFKKTVNAAIDTISQAANAQAGGNTVNSSALNVGALNNVENAPTTGQTAPASQNPTANLGPYATAVYNQLADPTTGLASLPGAQNVPPATQTEIYAGLADATAAVTPEAQQTTALASTSNSNVTVTPPPPTAPAPVPTPAPGPGANPNHAPQPPKILSDRELAMQSAKAMMQQGGLIGRQGQAAYYFLKHTKWSINGIFGGPIGNGTEESEGMNPMRSQATQTDVPASEVLAEGLLHGWGLWQSDPPTKVIEWCQAHGLNPNTVEGQGAWLIAEVNSLPNLKAQLEREDITVEEAADIFEQLFERAGNPALSVRETDGRAALNVFAPLFTQRKNQQNAALKQYQKAKHDWDKAQHKAAHENAVAAAQQTIAQTAKAILDPATYQNALAQQEQAHPGFNAANFNNGEDCAVAVAVAAAPVDKNFPVSGTVKQYDYMVNSPEWQRVQNTGSINDLKIGDIFSIGRDNGEGPNGHTFVYLGNGQIMAASMGDHGPQKESVYFHDDRNNQFGNSGNNIDIFRYVG